MLNTDLHNVAIEPKISLPQYVASCHRCVPLQHVPDTYLRAIYLSVLSSPLRISPDLAGVHSIVRSAPEHETVTGATFSVYSSINPDAPKHVKGTAPPAPHHGPARRKAAPLPPREGH